MADTAKKVAFGKKPLGKPTQERSAGEKWTSGIKDNLDVSSNERRVLAKYIPTKFIETDRDNPRRLEITKQEVEKLAEGHPIDKASLAEPSESFYSDYLSKIKTSTSFSDQKWTDLVSIVEFAFGLKDATRLLNPISVIQEDSNFKLVSGERRLFAHILLGESHIASTIMQGDVSRHEIDKLQWEENVLREDMTLIDRLDRVKKIVESEYGLDDISVSKLQGLIGISRTQCQRYLAILRCPNPILYKAIQDGIIADITKAGSLANLTSAELNAYFKGAKEKKTKTASVKFSKDIDSVALKKILVSAATSLSCLDVLKGHDLDKPKDLSAALEKLIQLVSKQK